MVILAIQNKKKLSFFSAPSSAGAIVLQQIIPIKFGTYLLLFGLFSTYIGVRLGISLDILIYLIITF